MGGLSAGVVCVAFFSLGGSVVFFGLPMVIYYDLWCHGDRLENSWFSWAALRDPWGEGVYMEVAKGLAPGTLQLANISLKHQALSIKHLNMKAYENTRMQNDKEGRHSDTG